MKEHPEHIEFLDLIVKDLSGELTSDDQQRLQDWVASNDDNRKLYDEYMKVWKEMDKVTGRTSREIDKEWTRLQQAIHEETDATIEKTRKTSMLWRIAASIVIFVTVGAAIIYVWNLNRYQEIISDAAVEQVELPEGSKVSLNVDTKLAYSKKFQSDTRQVELEGEAFFEVVQDTIRPFIIKTGDIQIEVLGTSFNVKAYPHEDQVEVTVERGKVAVYRIKNKNDVVILVKGEKAVFDKSSRELEALANENINYQSWKTKKIIFEDTPMSEVVRIINEIYQSDLRLLTTDLKDCPVTTTFDNQSLETILNVLSSTLNLTITKEGGAIIISGEGC